MGGIFGLITMDGRRVSLEDTREIERSIELIQHRGSFRYRVFTDHFVLDTKKFEEVRERNIEMTNTSFVIFNSLSQEEYNHINSTDIPIAFDGEIYSHEKESIIQVAREINTKNENKAIFLVKKFIQETDGVWAIVVYAQGTIYLFRDVLGVKPLWYGLSDRFFVFSSERKAIWALKMKAYPVIPRDVITYNLKNKKLHDYREITKFTYPEVFDRSKEQIKNALLRLMESALKKRFTSKHIAILFSGGVDSTFLSQLAKRIGYTVHGYCLKIGNSKDFLISREVASQIGIDLNVIDVDEVTIKDNIKKIVGIIEDYNPIRVSVASALYPVMKRIRDDGFNYAASGNGAEETFIGYRKYQELLNYGKKAVIEATIKGIENIWMRDIYRDDLLSAYLGLNTKLPFLDFNVVKYSLKVDPILKVNQKWKKLILREIAEGIGVPREIAWRKKLAAQYGTGVMKTLTKVSKSEGYKYLVDYFYDIFRNIYQTTM